MKRLIWISGLGALCACTGGISGDKCVFDDECAFDQICHIGVCEDALDRRYTFTIRDAQVGTSAPSGADWDLGGGAPDLLVDFGIGDVCSTSTVDDSFSPVWNQQCSLQLAAGSEFTIEVYDEDLSGYDFVAGWFWEGTDALVALARARGLPITVEDGSGTVSLQFQVDADF